MCTVRAAMTVRTKPEITPSTVERCQNAFFGPPSHYPHYQTINFDVKGTLSLKKGLECARRGGTKLEIGKNREGLVFNYVPGSRGTCSSSPAFKTRARHVSLRVTIYCGHDYGQHTTGQKRQKLTLSKFSTASGTWRP